MDKIVIVANPVRFGKITVFVNDAIKEVVAATTKELPAVVLTLAKQYKIKCIDIAGPTAYTKKVGETISVLGKKEYKKQTLSIQYIEGV